ncbi:MAG: beta-propeller domain-containing protein [Bacilli bacterium]|nr:beta-propeller domain-containing protein [Bacilli bacterium]
MKSVKRILCIVIIILLCISWIVLVESAEVRTIKSEKQLYGFYEQNNYAPMSLLKKTLLLPFSIFYNDNYIYTYETNGTRWNAVDEIKSNSIDAVEDVETTSSKDYSETNIQVEGVDEADILKTDGDYIYSISDDLVVITNVKNPDDIRIESLIKNQNYIPNDLLLYKDMLVVISSDRKNYYDQNTLVSIYNIKDKKNTELVKSLELKEPYYTSRCIDGQLYIFSKGYLREDDNKVERTYIEDKISKEIKLSDIKYLKNEPSTIQTLIAEVDLNKVKDVTVKSYLMDISNAYVSKNNIYLLDTDYGTDKIKISSLFSWKGVIGFFESIDNDYEEETKIYKFEMNKKKGISLKNTTKVKGSIINQYSLDEKDENLRIALETDDGTRISILDKNLKLLGETEKVAPGERMYASRFIGNKAYLVTYQNTDPLFVVELSNIRHPKVMGELKIPGYSTYLHPYDENHLIGIGMDSKETIIRDEDGRVINNWANITGMKMCLFDVSDINNPKELSKTTIGDSRTYSAVLTNPKALLFSKEKNLLAIPVNNYKDEIDTEDEEDDYWSSIISEGYFVYNVNLEDGFNLKGVINHEKVKTRYYYYQDSKLLRGLYIDDNLFTVSESAIKVNKLKDLTEIGKIELIEGEKDYDKE